MLSPRGAANLRGVRDSLGGEVSLVFSLLVHPTLTGTRPNASSTIVFHGGRAEGWNVNPDNDSVSVIDANLGTLVGEIPVADEPRAITVGYDGRVWVASKRASIVTIIDPSTLSIIVAPPGAEKSLNRIIVFVLNPGRN